MKTIYMELANSRIAKARECVHYLYVTPAIPPYDIIAALEEAITQLRAARKLVKEVSKHEG